MENLLAAPDADAETPVHRVRLIEGMVAAVDEKGYAATTIADIVRHARVSKRTFYEQFADREECFLACFSYGSELALAAVKLAADTALPWRQRVRDSTHAYLAALEGNPALTRTLLVEVHAVGPRALALRRTVLERFAALLCELVEQGRQCHPELRPLRPAMSIALVGGINELVLSTVEHGGTGRLHELADTVAELVEAVLSPLPEPPGPAPAPCASSPPSS
jgi:AcrR family transcriptional regulator